MHTQIRILGALAVVGLVAPAFTHVSAQATTAWTLMSTTAPQRTGHAMVFMPSRGVTILFGGVDATGADSQQTWEWNGTFWFLRGTGGPPARRNHAMCFNPVRNTIVLFGGFSATTGTLNDTWEFNGAFWTQVPSAFPPPARSLHAMAFNGSGVTMFGGQAPNGTRLGDTWNLHPGMFWFQTPPAGIPPMRSEHAMVFDPVLNRVLLHAGRGGPSGVGTPLADTWVFDVTAITNPWLPLAFPTSPAPLARIRPTMVFDDARQRTVIYGSATHRDTWEIDTTPVSPNPPTISQKLGTQLSMTVNTGHSLAFDSARARAVRLDGMLNTFEYAPVNPAVSITYGNSANLACTYGAGGRPTVDKASAADLLWLGTTSNVRVTGLPGFTTSVFLNLGLSNTQSAFGPLPLNLGFLGAPNCVGLASTDSTLGPIITTTLATFVDFGVITPNSPSFIGMQVFAQGVVVDQSANALGMVFSNGLDMTVGQK